MTERSTASSPVRRWFNGFLLALITSALLMIILQLFSRLGAKEFVEDVSKETLAAVHSFTPTAMGRKYLDSVKQVTIGPCLNLPYNEVQKCFSAHPTPQGFSAVWTYFRALFHMIGNILNESSTQSVIDVMQLIAGFAAAIALSARLKLFRAEYSLHLSVLFVPLGILLTCLLSVPMLWILHFASSVFGDMLPQVSASLFGGTWAGFVVICSGRAVEERLHHFLGPVVKRVLRLE